MEWHGYKRLVYRLAHPSAWFHIQPCSIHCLLRRCMICHDVLWTNPTIPDRVDNRDHKQCCGYGRICTNLCHRTSGILLLRCFASSCLYSSSKVDLHSLKIPSKSDSFFIIILEYPAANAFGNLNCSSLSTLIQ